MSKEKQSLSLNDHLEECIPALKEHARKYLGKDAQHLCDDALSDTCLKALQKFSTFDPEKPFLPWIRKILERVCIDKLRSLKPKKKEKQRVKTKDIEEIEDAATRVEWLPDEDGVASPQSVEDFIKTLEQTGMVDMSIHIENKPGECEVVYWRDNHFAIKRFTWAGPHEPPGITLLKEIVKGTSRKAMGKKFRKSQGTLDVAIHRMKKKVDG
jgi:RNA polymerase sigma factor (sigma-70 family)